MSQRAREVSEKSHGGVRVKPMTKEELDIQRGTKVEPRRRQEASKEESIGVLIWRRQRKLILMAREELEGG